jgi:hypothetical membrane protein
MRLRAGSRTHPAAGRALPAWAGIVGPVLFTAVFLAQEAVRRGEYNPIAETISGLEAGPNGWIQQVNFVVFGVLTIAFAVGLHHGLALSPAGILGPALLAVSGIGLVLAAAFPLREDALGRTFDPGGHVVAGVTFFLSSALGLIVLSRRLSRDPQWRNLAGYTVGAGAVALAAFVAMGVVVVPDDGPLHEWAGLAQRALVLVVLFPCRIVLALRLLRLGHATRQ